VTTAENKLRSQIAAHESWAHTPDRAARTAPARAALDAKFLQLAEGDPQRAGHLRKAHFARLALKSARARRGASEARKAIPDLERQAAEADAELTAGGR